MRPKLSRSPRSRLSASEISVPRKTFVSYERKATFHIISYQGEISLVNLSKCFLGNRDNFCPYEQALNKLITFVVVKGTNKGLKLFNRFIQLFLGRILDVNIIFSL